MYIYSYISALSHKLIYEQGFTKTPLSLNSSGQIISDIGTTGYSTIFICLAPLIATILAIVSANQLVSISLGLSFIIFNFSAGSYRLLGVATSISFILSLLYIRPLCELNRVKLKIKPFMIRLLIFVPIIFFGIGSFSKALVRSWFWKDSAQYGLDQRLEEGFQASDLFNGFHCFDSLLALFYSVPQLTGGFSFFVPNLRLFIWPIPRQIWPDKPVIPDIIDIFATGRWAPLTLGFLGDAYKNLSIPGILICSLLIAIIFRYLYAKATATLIKKKSLLFLVAYICTLSYISVFLRDGGTSWAVFVIPLWIFIWLLKPLLPIPADTHSKILIPLREKPNLCS